MRAVALLRLEEGMSAPQIAEVLPMTQQAVRNLARRYQQGGLERALYDKQRPPLLLHGIARRTRHGHQTTLTITSLHARARQMKEALQRASAFLQEGASNCGAVDPSSTLATDPELDFPPISPRQSPRRPFVCHRCPLATAVFRIKQSENWQTLGVPVVPLSKQAPPAAQAFDGKLRRVVRRPDVDEPLVSLHIVGSIRGWPCRPPVAGSHKRFFQGANGRDWRGCCF